MNDSRTTTIGIILIFVVFIGWFLYMNSQTPKPTKPAKSTAADTTKPASPTAAAPEAAAPAPATPAHDTTQHSTVFATATSAPATTKTIETPLFVAQISSTGAAISDFQLKKYKTWDKKPVNLVNHEDYHGGDINLKFVASDGKVVETNSLPFLLDAKSLSLGDNDSAGFSAVYRLDSGRSIEKVFHFSGKGYLIGIEYRLHGLENSVGGYHFTAALDDPLPYVEQRSQDESSNAKAFAGLAGDLEDLTVTKPGTEQNKPLNGSIQYAGMRNQYFEQAMIPLGVKAISAELNGRAAQATDGGVLSKYTAAIHVPIERTHDQSLSFALYFGPLEYDRIEALGVGLEQSMNFGWAFLVRPISIHLLLPFFLWLHGFFANWGVVIIVFSIVIKLVTIPLSTGQMRSMRKMQVLQPKVTEVRDKYKDDPKKMNEELLKVYRTYGVNPAGGCLPLLLQMPILFALYQVLKNVIQLRQAPFAFWINDLSVPDALFHFNHPLPLVGWDHISGLTLLLVVTMFVQQLFTVTDPRQKSMAYIMPIVFIFMFNNLPSGVGLYYFMFNIFGLLQQLYLTKIATPPSIEEMKANPKNGGGIMARLQDMEKQQRQIRQQQYTGKKR